MNSKPFAVNLGGEGEIPGILNQQPLRAAEPGWRSAKNDTLADLIRAGHTFLLCPNDSLSLPDECADRVFTNNVPIDITNAWYGPGVQSSEIKRILKPGGQWIDNGTVAWTKP